jgi:hypothetical protein
MKRKFCCDSSSDIYRQYYLNQAGHGMPVFQGSRGQRGHGIGSVLGGLFRSGLPLLKRAGKQVLKSASNIISDMAAGKKFSDVALGHIAKGISSFANDESASDQTGGRRVRRVRRRALKRKRVSKPKKSIKRRKRARNDIFG